MAFNYETENRRHLVCLQKLSLYAKFKIRLLHAGRMFIIISLLYVDET